MPTKDLEHHKELLRPVEATLEPSPLQQFLKRLFTIVIALFLLFLILFYFVPGSEILSIFESKTVSNVVTDHSIALSGGRTVVFTPEVFDQLQTLYLDNQAHEFSACLVGTLKEKTYSVTNILLPKTYEQEVFHVTATLCPKETLIALHSHPYKQCIFSEADISYYQAFAKINKDGLIGVICEPTRFGFYP